MVQNTPMGCGNDSPTLLKTHFFRFPAVFVLDLFLLRSFWNLHFLLCLEESATTKMTALTDRSFYGFHEQVSATWYLPVRFTFLLKITFSGFPVH